jgi:hypothetical protein
MANFRGEIYDFDLNKGFFTEKMTQIRQISKGRFFPNRQIFIISSTVGSHQVFPVTLSADVMVIDCRPATGCHPL